MHRTLILLIGVVLLCGIAQLRAVQHSGSNQTQTDPPSEAKQLQALNDKMDAMMRRIIRLEQRVARMEEGVVRPRFRTDEHGILRDQQDQPVGIWGVDSPQEVQQQVVPR